MSRRRSTIAAFVLLTASLAGYVACEARISSDLGLFLASEQDRDLSAVAGQMLRSQRMRTMILALSSPDLEDSIAAAREWSLELATHPMVEAARAGPDPDFLDAAFSLYFPRRWMLLSAEPERELPARLSLEGLRAAARRLLGELSRPEGALIRRWAGADPLMIWPTQLRELAGAQRSVTVRNGTFVAGDPPRAVLFVTTRESAFDAENQEPFLHFVAQSFAALDARWPVDLALEQSGPHRFAVASEQHARADAAWISVVSLGALIVGFHLVYRSWAVLLLILAPLGFGVLGATAATVLVFGDLHALTLAFGATLIGICTDYPVHLLTHGAFRPPGAERSGVVHRIRAPILLAAATSAAGFAGIATSQLPGIQQIGCFAVAGVASAALATVVLVPELAPARVAPTPLAKRWVRRTEQWLSGSERRRVPAALLVLAAAGFAAAGAAYVRWDDDVFAWNAPLEPEWLREDHRLRDALQLGDAGQLVVVIAADDELALKQNDAVYSRLLRARSEGAIGSFRSLHPILPSRELQLRNLDVVGSVPHLSSRIARAFEQEGFRRDAFADALATPDVEPLVVKDLLASPLRLLVETYRLELSDGRVALLTWLDDVRDPEALHAAIADVPNAYRYDQRRFVGSLYAKLRARTLRLLAAGSLGVIALVWVRYRRLDRTVAAAAPGFLAAVSTLGLLSLAGVPLTLLHLLGLLLVMSLGVDYGIFLAESRSDPRSEGVSLFSVTLDWLSTLLSFGLLAGSSFPALRALGVSTAIGITLTLFLALAARALLPPRPCATERRFP
ncbi:MAG: MMPL family transporter [Deltaproteobacteria bacterium]|nr:MMPL family transporter [Deltaproteobacteria bacterium]